MRSLLMQAAENVTTFVSQETWSSEFIESHGSITQLVNFLISFLHRCIINNFKICLASFVRNASHRVSSIGQRDCLPS